LTSSRSQRPRPKIAEQVEFEREVVEALLNAMFRVQLDSLEKAGHCVRLASGYWYPRSSASRRVSRRVAGSIRPHGAVGRG
jgi:hypothetical protein